MGIGIEWKVAPSPNNGSKRLQLNRQSPVLTCNGYFNGQRIRLDDAIRLPPK